MRSEARTSGLEDQRGMSVFVVSSCCSTGGSSNSTSKVEMSAAAHSTARPCTSTVSQDLHHGESSQACAISRRNSNDGQLSGMKGGLLVLASLLHFWEGAFHSIVVAKPSTRTFCKSPLQLKPVYGQST